MRPTDINDQHFQMKASHSLRLPRDFEPGRAMPDFNRLLPS